MQAQKLNKSKKKLSLLLLVIPLLALTFLFKYFPLYGWVYSFYDYRPPLSLSQCKFVGFQWFTTLVSSPARIKNILNILRNTFVMSGLGILFSWLPMIFAVFLSEIKCKWYKKSIQTLTTLPNFISWVLVYSLAFSLFSTNGMANTLLMDLGLIDTQIQFLEASNAWGTMWLWNTWKGLGWGAIMYLAAISGIDQGLFEAAKVDGASRMKIIWHITIPSLLPTYFILLMLNIASFLNNGMEQYFVFQNAFNKNTIQVLDLYVYNIAIGSGSYSLATAIGILKSIVSLVLLVTVNTLSRIFRGESMI